jgi:hypothetical protein
VHVISVARSIISRLTQIMPDSKQCLLRSGDFRAESREDFRIAYSGLVRIALRKRRGKSERVEGQKGQEAWSAPPEARLP